MTSAKRERRSRWLPPWWTAAFPVAALVGVAAWFAATGERAGVSGFLLALAWPGSAAALAVALVVWLAWILDLE